ncbi:MAG: ABC transporter permease [Solirubrobacteraceae bacterium]
MRSLFGIPVGTLLAVLGAALALALGALAVLALRNRVLVRLGVRNVGRRRSRSALIVAGLMLGTTIIAAAMVTGDTMSTTIRRGVVQTLGQTDEIVSARAAKAEVATGVGAATGVRYFGAGVVARIDRALAGSGLTDGVTPAIVEPVAVQDPGRRQNEPRVTLFAADPARMAGFGRISSTRGGAATLAALGAGEAYLNAHAAGELHARPGDRVVVFTPRGGVALRVRDVVRYDGAGTTDSALLIGLGAAQRMLGRPGLVEHVLVSNRGGTTSGAGHTAAVVRRLKPVLAPLGLQADPAKRDAIRDADRAGSAFMAFFTTFGSFSIAAGILLIFLIFVMLAAERRGELGIARAIGTRRGHLVSMFVFEGVAYDVLAALAGAALGVAVAYGMVTLLARALGSQGFDIQFGVTSTSLLIAYAIGVLLTLGVVALSAWRVSRMTVAAAIRDLPEPLVTRRRRRLAGAAAVVGLGALLAVSGAQSSTATPLILGVSVVVAGAVPLLRAAGVGERLAYTGAGLAIVVLWLLPWSTWESVFGPLKMDFSTWIASGLMVVVGAVWTIMYNAPVLLAGASAALGRSRRLAPVARMAVAYPLAARFRSGVTLAMFTLVVFTLVTGTATSGSFQHAFGRTESFGGGFDVRASTPPATPVDDLRTALARTPAARPQDFRAIGSQSLLPVDARQSGTRRRAEPYPLRGLDPGFTVHTTFRLAALARGYGSARAVWDAIARRPGLAVVDGTVVPRRDNFNFSALPPAFRITGFYVDSGRFDPVRVAVRDAQTGRRTTLTVIGVLSDTAPPEMFGLATSQRTMAAAFPGRAGPTIHYLQVAPGVDPGRAASRLEAAFLDHGMQAESIAKITRDATRSGRTFNLLVEGFMGLGLVVGVAALGVVSARAVVERRQQIGVLRAVGFRREMVQGAFLLESSFIALTAIVVGSVLGLILAANIVRDQRRNPSWSDITLVVPWLNLAIIFLVVFAVAMLATLAPARRAARVAPAEALRYQ